MTVALDLFAGTGWGVACQALGITEHGVELMPAAVETRTANGMHTAFADVWAGLRDPSLVPEHDVLIASPPCQTFSVAGAGAGRRALDEVIALIDSGAWLDPDELQAFGQQHDDRTALVLTPLTYAMRYRPRVIILEQVPTVLPVWQAIARVLRLNGYQAEAAVLNAEQYGVPQTRKRAILVAVQGGAARLPEPTHSRYYPRDPARLDEGVLPWVSMAEALGWGMTARPYLTIASSRTSGGPDMEKVGGSGARRIIYAERDAGRWTMNGAGMSELSGHGRARARKHDEPAHTITGAGSAAWLPNRPARTVTTRDVIPAPGVSGHDARRTPLAIADRFNDQSGTPFDSEWPAKRPATVVAGRDIVQNPGATGNRFNGSTKSRNDGVRVSLEEAAVLQSYPVGFEWRGTSTARFQQVGNAVPPLLALRVLEAAGLGSPE